MDSSCICKYRGKSFGTTPPPSRKNPRCPWHGDPQYRHPMKAHGPAAGRWHEWPGLVEPSQGKPYLVCVRGCHYFIGEYVRPPALGGCGGWMQCFSAYTLDVTHFAELYSPDR